MQKPSLPHLLSIYQAYRDHWPHQTEVYSIVGSTTKMESYTKNRTDAYKILDLNTWNVFQGLKRLIGKIVLKKRIAGSATIGEYCRNISLNHWAEKSAMWNYDQANKRYLWLTACPHGLHDVWNVLTSCSLSWVLFMLPPCSINVPNAVALGISAS